MKLLQKSKELLKKISGWCRNHKFLTIVIIAGLISAAVFAANRKMLFDTATYQQQTSYSFVRTTTLQKNGLEQSVNATGSVESANTSTVSYSSQGMTGGAKIKTVKVTVGDTVKKGDIIVVLDNETILENITKEEENLAEKIEKALNSYNTAKETYDSAVTAYNSSVSAVSAAATKLSSAQKEYENAAASISNFQKAYDDAAAAEAKAVKEYNDALTDYESRYAAAQAEYDAAKAAYDAAVTARENAQKAYDDALTQSGTQNSAESNADSSTQSMVDETASQADSTATVDVDALYAQLETAKSNEAAALQKLNDAQAALQALDRPQANYQEAQNKTKEAQAMLNTAKSSAGYDKANSAYTQAQKDYDSAVSARDQQKTKMDSAKTSMETAYENYVDSQTSETLNDLKEQLNDCNLVAETDGKITSLNATVGGTANGTIAQIMDTDSLKISITVSEADINDISIGMKCKIRSDATDGEISGTLTQIDPVSGQGGSFGAEVTVNDSGTGLLIGMNADVDIIISETEDCFTVPVDAVGDDDDGLGSYILRKTAGEGVDMEFEKVYVTTGESNDYYIEVNADSLAVGDVIRSYSDLSIGIETVTGEDAAQLTGFENMFGGMGGFGGGTMPGGDNFGGNSGGRPGGGNAPDFEGGGGMPSGFGGGGQ